MALTETQARAAAEELVARYAPEAPASVVTQAVDLLVHSLGVPAFVQSVAAEDQNVSHHPGFDMLRRAGITSLLASYRRPRALRLDPPSQ